MNRPYRSGVTVTPDDDTIFSRETSGLYEGTTGDIEVVFYDGSTATLANVPAGIILDISVVKVTENTTASDIVALF